MNVKLRIGELRKRTDLSQTELGQRVGVQRAAVCRWESNVRVPPVERLPSIAAALGCTVDELYDPALVDQRRQMVACRPSHT